MPARANIDLHTGAAKSDKQSGVYFVADRRGCRAGQFIALVHLKLRRPLGATDAFGVLIQYSGQAGKDRCLPTADDQRLAENVISHATSWMAATPPSGAM